MSIAVSVASTKFRITFTRSIISLFYFVGLILLLSSLLFLTGCGGSGGGNGTSSVGSNGGTVESSDGLLTLTIPAGALGNATEITITEIQTGSAGALAYTLEPDGLAFMVPASLSLDVSSLISTTKGSEQSLVTAFRVSSDGSAVESLAGQTVTTDFDAGSAILSGSINGFSTLVAEVRPGFTVQLENVPDQVPENTNFPSPLVGSVMIGEQGIDFDINAVQYVDSSIAPVMILDSSPFQVLAAPGQRDFSISRLYACGPAGVGEVIVTLSVVDFLDNGLSSTILSTFVSDPNALSIPAQTYGYILRQKVKCVGIDGGTGSDDSDGSGSVGDPIENPEQPDVIDIDISDNNVEFNHTVGVTGCPQSLGSFTITNSGTVPVTVSISGGSAIAASLLGDPVLAPGASINVDVAFLCSQTSNVNETLTVTGTAQNGQSTSGAVSVMGNVSK